MRDTLQVGLADEATFVVTADMAPGHLPVVVLSTPAMIGRVEGVCAALAATHLDEGETTVGTHVCMSHRGAAYEGETVTIRVSIQEIDRRRLTFAEEVLTERGSISTGTHERTVIRTDRYAS